MFKLIGTLTVSTIFALFAVNSDKFVEKYGHFVSKRMVNILLILFILEAGLTVWNLLPEEAFADDTQEISIADNDGWKANSNLYWRLLYK